jgi:hypothetical protein
MCRIEISWNVRASLGFLPAALQAFAPVRGIMALFRRRRSGYIRLMKQLSQVPVATAAKIALGIALLAAATGLAFASWIDKGAGIFMATVEAGLAWCF